MAVARQILTGWLAGELSPFLSGRIETEQYRYGLDTCENFIPTIEGPLVKRSGFAMIREADPTSTWLTAFRRLVTQEYVVEWGEEKARFYTNGGRIETEPGVAYEITTPYAAADAPTLSLQQSFDRQYIAHGDYAPGALRRDGAALFTIETLELKNGPFADPNGDESVTVYASSASGTATLTANSALFDAGMVGSPVMLEAIDFGDIVSWASGMKDIAIGDKCYNEDKVYQAATAGNTGDTQPTHSEGSYYDGANSNDVLNDTGPYGVKWTYLHDRFGVGTITAVASGTSATVSVTRRMPDGVVGSGNATWRWRLGAFNAFHGWPHLNVLHAGRLIYLKGYDIVGSVVGDYGGGRVNFATFSNLGRLAPDLAFRRQIATEDAPIWVAKDRQLIVGTPTRELAIGPVNAAAALSGENIEAQDQSSYGSEAVAPVQLGTETIFVQRGGKRLRAADFDFARDRYDAADLTAAAKHIGGSAGFIQLAFQREPEAMIYAVSGDGHIAAHPKSRLEIKGFGRFVLGGGARVLSAVSIAADDGRTEELWVLVQREDGSGATVKEVWKQEPLRQLGTAQEEQFFVDGGVRIAASAGQTEFTGLDHLANQDVAVLAAGGVVPGQSVDGNGVLTLPATSVPGDRAFTVIVGLPFTATAVGLRPNIQLRGGQSSQGVKQRLVYLTLRLLETMGIKVGTPDPDDPLEPIIDREADDFMDEPIPLKTGDYGGEVDADFDRDGRPRWVSDDPVAAVVTASILKMEVDEKDV